MKKILPILTLLASALITEAQVTIPNVRANFGVDGDLRANYFNGLIITGNDDWYRTNGTVGEFIIDTTGASFILSRYAVDPAFRRLPFFRGMRHPQFSVINNRLLIDGIFIRDYHGDDSTVFASGSNKNGQNPDSWNCPVSQGIPDKNDILDMFMHVRRDGPNGTDSLWLFGGVSIENTTGNRYFDFEMYQTDIYYDRSVRKFFGYGPDAGHTSWQFDAAGNVTKPGDVIFTAEYSSAGLTLVEARIWINQSSLSVTPVPFNWGGQFDGDGSGAVFGYANILPKSVGDYYTGLLCSNNTWGGPFQIVRQDNSLAANYTARQFMEFSVNLSKLGLDPYITSNDVCGMPFRRIMVKTRASTSFTAELKDFVGPFDFFRAPRANAAAVIPLFCGSNGVTDINVTNPLLTSLYTWSTTDGHIVTDSVGPSITVDAPGTYIVRQELMDSCGTSYARDTVIVTLDTNCALLRSYITDFKVGLGGDLLPQLNWTVTNNQSTAYFNIERSDDGSNFNTIGRSNSSNLSLAKYQFTDISSQIKQALTYYRLKNVDINGKISYSKIITLQNTTDKPIKVRITSDPSGTNSSLVISAQRSGPGTIRIYNSAGLLIRQIQAKIQAGTTIINLSNKNSSLKAGIYFVNLIVDGERITSKLVIN